MKPFVHPFLTPTPLSNSELAPAMQELPFIVRVASFGSDFAALCAFRSQAYSRHDYTATLAARLARLDENDCRAFLMIALDKATGDCIGTLRISLTTRGEVPMAPYEPLGIVQGQHFAYVDRFAVHVADNHATVRLALIKAMWLLVCGEGAPWIVCSALAPLARLYRGVGLYAIPGAEEGFLHPRLHDTAHYYMCGGHRWSSTATSTARTPSARTGSVPCTTRTSRCPGHPLPTGYSRCPARDSCAAPVRQHWCEGASCPKASALFRRERR